MDSDVEKSQWTEEKLKHVHVKREISEVFVERIFRCILLMDKTVSRSKVQDLFLILQDAIRDFLSEVDSDFVSNNSKDFKEYLESKVGTVYFARPFAVRIRPDSIRLFINGEEIEEQES